MLQVISHRIRDFHTAPPAHGEACPDSGHHSAHAQDLLGHKIGNVGEYCRQGNLDEVVLDFTNHIAGQQAQKPTHDESPHKHHNEVDGSLDDDLVRHGAGEHDPEQYARQYD